MKKALLLIFLLNCGIGISQNKFPVFEQIAFEYYSKEILKKHPVKKRITLNRYYSNYQQGGTYIPDKNCFKNNLEVKNLIEIDKDKYRQNNNESDKFEFDLSKIDKKKFKIRKKEKNRYPKLFFSYPLVSKKNPNRIFVNVLELYDLKVNAYHIEINLKGEVVDWCHTLHEI